MIRRYLYVIGLFTATWVIAQEAPVSPVVREEVVVDVKAIVEKVRNPFLSLIVKPIVENKQPMFINTVQDQVERTVSQAINRTNEMMPRVAPSDRADIKPVVEEKIPNVSIEGLIWSDTIHQAIIDGQVLGIGDKINEMTIRDINAKGIIVDFHGKQYSIAHD